MGDEYRGSFVDGKRDGFGIYKWSSWKSAERRRWDEGEYIGEWKADEFHGFGHVGSVLSVSQSQCLSTQGTMIRTKECTKTVTSMVLERLPVCDCFLCELDLCVCVLMFMCAAFLILCRKPIVKEA